MYLTISNWLFGKVGYFAGAFSKRISSTFLTFGSSKRRKNLSEEVHRKCCHDPFLFSCISKVLGDAYLKHATCDFHAGDERIPSDEEQNVLDLVESYITAEGDDNLFVVS